MFKYTAKYLFSILIIVNLLLIIAYLYVVLQNNDLFNILTNENLLSIILGLFTSTLVSFLIFWLDFKYIQPNENFHIRNIFDEVIAKHELEYPENIYYGSSSPNATFNAHLNADLARTDFFFFQGRSGKYIPIRLLKNKNIKRKDNIKLIINNPFNEYNAQILDSHKMGYDIKITHTHYINNFYVMLYGFFKCYSLVENIEIIFSNTPIFHRVELCTDKVYLQTFLKDDFRKNEFPTIYSYKPNSFIYNHTFGNLKIKQYKYLQGKEKFYQSDFVHLSVKYLFKNNLPIINGIKIDLKKKPSNDEEIFVVLNKLIKDISEKVIVIRDIQLLFKRLNKDVA
jgi:hypothetical protein